jgi:anti-anti-sigma regulatory factor
MENSGYSVRIKGIKEGLDPVEVRDRVAAYFNVSPEKYSFLLAGRPVVFKKRMDLATARRYQKFFEVAGAVCSVVRLGGAAFSAGAQAHEIQKAAAQMEGADLQATGTFDNVEEEVSEEDLSARLPTGWMMCPKCGQVQIQSPTCVRCFAVVADYTKTAGKEGKWDLKILFEEKDLLYFSLSGRVTFLDYQEFDMKFQRYVVLRKRPTIVNMKEVSQIAAICVRSLVQSARVLEEYGGKLVLFDPQPDVEETLVSDLANSRVIITRDIAEAQALLRAEN